MDYDTIIMEKEAYIGTLILNRPEKLNVLNDKMFQEICTALDEAAEDDQIRVLVITGAGRAFCAGGEIGSMPGAEGGRSPEEYRQHLSKVQNTYLKLYNFEKPTIAMVNGVAVGGGFDLALACDMRVGSEKAKFMVAFTRIGLIPGTGGMWLMPRILGMAKACELIFTGDFIEGEEAEKTGILSKLVSSENLEKETMALAAKIAKGPPIAIKLAKMQLYRGLELSNLEAALQYTAAAQLIVFSSEDHKEGVRAFMEKREPVFQGK